MSDQNRPVGFERAGNPATPSQAAPGGGTPGATPEGQNHERPITLTEVQRLIQDAVQSTLRQTQSVTDRQEAKLRKELQDKLAQISQVQKTMEAAGVQITPEIQDRIRRQVIDDSLLGTAAGTPQGVSDPAAQPGQPSAEQPQANLDPINQAALSMMEEAGIQVLSNDPEAAMLDHSNRRAFLRSLDQAIEAKRQRMQGQPQTPAAPAGTRAPTNLGGVGQQTGLMEQYQREISNPGLPQHMRLEVRRKYRRLGLNV